MAITRNFQGERAPQKWEDNESHDISVDDARQAVPLGHIRYVLGVSLALVIVLFAIIYLTYAR